MDLNSAPRGRGGGVGLPTEGSGEKRKKNDIIPFGLAGHSPLLHQVGELLLFIFLSFCAHRSVRPVLLSNLLKKGLWEGSSAAAIFAG